MTLFVVSRLSPVVLRHAAHIPERGVGFCVSRIQRVTSRNHVVNIYFS